MSKVLFDVLWINWSLINLDDVTLLVDQKRCWQTEVTMAVKKMAIENVVNSSDIVRSVKDGTCKVALAY